MEKFSVLMGAELKAEIEFPHMSDHLNMEI